MKTTILVLALLYSLSLLAQTKTVGGVRPTDPPDGTVKDIASNLQGLEDLLLSREVLCGVKKVKQPNDTLMDSYYRLSLTKVSIHCDVTLKALKCINNSELKAVMSEINQNPKSAEHLAKKFEIDIKSAQDVLRFFENLGKVDPT